MEIPKGVVYFDCPIDAEPFSEYLAELIDYREPIKMSEGLKRRIEVTNKEDKKPDPANEPSATFMKLTRPLTAAAELFFANYSRPMTLVLDSVDRLAKQKPVFLERLQDFAKDCTGKNKLRIVFISSDGSALPILTSRSAWSRAGAPFEIGEVSDSEAIAYLIGEGVPEDQAELAVDNLTGGLFASLNNVVDFIRRGYTYSQILEIRNRLLQKTLKLSKVDLNDTLFKHLVAHGKASLDFVESDIKPDVLTELVVKNVLAVHPDESYTFHDRHVTRWFKLYHANETEAI
jgi:hypothetical protein